VVHDHRALAPGALRLVELGAQIAEETKRWAAVVKDANIRVE